MKTVDLIIFGGQSNMQGECEVLSETEVVADALEYRLLDDALVPLQNPVGEDIRYDGGRGKCFHHWETTAEQWCADHVLGSACEGRTSLIPSFCRAYIAGTGRAVVAVPAAKGSTRVDQWMPGSDGYAMLTKKVNAAIAHVKKEYTIGHIYLAFLQGESDAIESVPGDLYKERLNALREAFVAEFGLETFGIIRVGRFTMDARDDVIINAQSEICREQEGFLMLTEAATDLNGMPDMMNPYVGGHYSAKGLETLGRLAGETLARHAQGQ